MQCDDHEGSEKGGEDDDDVIMEEQEQVVSENIAQPSQPTDISSHHPPVVVGADHPSSADHLTSPTAPPKPVAPPPLDLFIPLVDLTPFLRLLFPIYESFINTISARAYINNKR